MKNSNKSSYTKSCHCQSSRPQDSGILRVLSSYVKREESFLTNNTYVEDPRQNSSGMTALLTRVRAFTLMELLVVVLIIGVLAAVAIPQYQKVIKQAKLREWTVIRNSLLKGFELWKLDNAPRHAIFTGKEWQSDNLGNYGAEYVFPNAFHGGSFSKVGGVFFECSADGSCIMSLNTTQDKRGATVPGWLTPSVLLFRYYPTTNSWKLDVYGSTQLDRAVCSYYLQLYGPTFLTNSAKTACGV